MRPRVADAHVHVIPPSVVAGMRAGTAPTGARVEREAGREMVAHARGYRHPLVPEFHDTNALLDRLARMGTGYAVISPAPPLFAYGLDEEAGAAWANQVNEGIAAMVAEHPHALRGLATLPLRHPRAAERQLCRAVDELGLAGAIVGPHADGLPLDDEALHGVLSAAQRLGAVLFVHPYYTGAKPGLEELYLTNLVGNPLETCVCAARLALSGTLERLAGLRVLLAHGGGYLPYQVGRLDHGSRVRPELAEAPGPPSSYLRSFFYDSLTHLPASTGFLIDLVGADRVVLGSDLPFDMGGCGLDSQLTGLELSAPKRAGVAFDTAKALFGFTDADEGPVHARAL